MAEFPAEVAYFVFDRGNQESMMLREHDSNSLKLPSLRLVGYESYGRLNMTGKATM